LVFILGGIVALTKLDSVNRLLLADNSYSLMTRLEAWRIVLEIVKINPFLGLGPSNYYFYTPLFPILGYSVQFNSHNNYVDIIAQTGFLGLLCFFWLAGEIGLLGWNLRERVPQGSFARAYVYGALGGLAGSLAAAMLGDWLIPFVYNIGLAGFRASVLAWLFLGGLVVIESTFHNNRVSSTS
jgi:O-antigen ligase